MFEYSLEQIQTRINTRETRKPKSAFSKLKSGEKVVYIIASAFVWIMALTMLFPFFWMFSSALKSIAENQSTSLIIWSANPNWGIFQELFSKVNFGRAILNTVIVEICVIPVGTFVSSLAAFAISKLRFRHKKTLLVILMTSMMIPYCAVMLPQYRAFDSLGMVNTLWPLIIPGMFGRISMMFFLITYMKGAIHNSVVESAKIDGASYFRMYWQIALPASKTAIAAQVIFWFVAIWNDYFAPSLYLTDPEQRTIQVLINMLNSETSGNLGLPLMMAASFLASIPMIIFFLIFRNMFVANLSLSGVKE